MKKTVQNLLSNSHSVSTQFNVLKNSKRCSQMCDSNNDVLSKLVLSDTAWSLDVILCR